MRAITLPLALLGACATAPEPQHPAASPLQLAGTRWIRTDDDSSAPHFPTMEFTDTGASGFAGCNRWFAEAAIDGAALRFAPVGTTKMMCPPPAMAAEQSMLDALSRTRAARREGEELVVLDDSDAVIARFTRVEEPER